MKKCFPTVLLATFVFFVRKTRASEPESCCVCSKLIKANEVLVNPQGLWTIVWKRDPVTLKEIRGLFGSTCKQEESSRENLVIRNVKKDWNMVKIFTAELRS
jgi:hypothetical protein